MKARSLQPPEHGYLVDIDLDVLLPFAALRLALQEPQCRRLPALPQCPDQIARLQVELRTVARSTKVCDRHLAYETSEAYARDHPLLTAVPQASATGYMLTGFLFSTFDGRHRP